MTNETLKSDNRREAKGKRAEFQKAKPASEGKTTVIHVARTAKVVKGGKRFGFRALVVVGNGEGKVGVAIGKANQVQLAIGKAETHARKHMITFPDHSARSHRPLWRRFRVDETRRPGYRRYRRRRCAPGV